MPENNHDVILLTPAGYQRIEQELQHLSTVRRQEIAARMRESKEHGEYSEDNTELDEVKFEQALVEGRIVDLKSILSNAHVLTPDDIPAREIGIGSKVRLARPRSKDEITVTLVSSVEADPDNGCISNESPLGEAILGKKKGDKVTVEAPAGKVSYEIKAIGKAVK